MINQVNISATLCFDSFDEAKLPSCIAISSLLRIPVGACFRLQMNIADWLTRCGLFAYRELWESSEAENGPDQCLKLLPEKRQTLWPTVDIVGLHIDRTLQQYVLHDVADPRWRAFRSCFGRRPQKNGLRSDQESEPKQVNFDKIRIL